MTEFGLIANVGHARQDSLYLSHNASTAAQSPQYPPNAEQVLAISGSPTSSNPFQPQTTLIRVHTDAICSIEIGQSPTATTSTARMAANQTEYFGVYPGHSISVIANV